MGIFQTLRTAARLPDLLASSALQPAGLASPWSPSTHLAPMVLSDVFGADHLPLTREAAMKVPAVARARRLICTTVPRFPLVAVDTHGEPLDAQPPFLTRSDGVLSPYHRMVWTMDDLLFYGWSLWAVRRYADTGKVAAAERVPRHSWTFGNGGEILIDGTPANAADVLLIPGLDEGLLTYGDRAIRHADRLIAAAETAAENPSPTLELHQTSTAPMTDPEIDKMIARWAAARRGKNGGVAYTNHAIELREHKAVSEHLLIEGRNAAAVDVARAVGIPAAMIDASGPTSSLTYQTVQGRNAEFVDYGLAPFMAAVTGRLGMDDVVASGVAVRFELGDYTTPAGGVIGTPDDYTPPTGQESTR